MASTIEKSTLHFLEDLSINNDRDWFSEHKDRYLAAQQNMIQFADGLLALMQKHDFIETPSGKASLMRIYRDTRFSKDKTPYRDYFGGGFRRATNRLRGGYYYQIGYQEALVAGGFFGPNREDLMRIRKDIDLNGQEWREMLNDPSLKIFGKLQGNRLATVPRGYPKDHVAVDLLRHKSFYFEKRFSINEMLSDLFVQKMNVAFQSLRPFFDFMSTVLTTDANGVSLFE